MELNDFKKNILPLKNRMFRVALRILYSQEDAEEAVQETFIKIWQKRESIRDESNLEGFAIIVLRNHCIDKLKSKHFIHRASNIDDYEFFLEYNGPSPEKIAEFKNAADLVKAIIEDFPERWRSIIQLRDIEGYSNSEVAEMLAIDENIVKVTLSRTRKKIREILMNKYNYSYNEN